MIDTTLSLFGLLPGDFVAEVHSRRMSNALDRRQWEKRGATMPTGYALSPTVVAEINQGRWIVRCPFCYGGGEVVDPEDPRFFCLSCFNAAADHQWLGVVFPSDRIEIESVLEVRSDPDWRNWTPTLTVLDLVYQNSLGSLIFHHSWTAPRTWVTGEIVSASNMNTHVRDNLLETSVAKSTTQGDITYATGANALARLAIGAGFSKLQVNSGATALQYGEREQVVMKAADENRTSNTTYSDDAELTFAIAANAKVKATLELIAVLHPTPLMKAQITVPSGCVIAGSALTYNGAGSIVLFANSTSGTLTIGVPISYILSNAAAAYPPWWFYIVNGANAGNITLQWAQNTSDVNPTTIKAGSRWRINPIT